MSSPEQQLKFYLSTRFSEVVVNLSTSAIQMFMWLYMMSFYVEAPIETRKRRLPYVSVSFVIVMLFSVSSIILAITVFPMLFEAIPGDVEASVDAIIKYEEKTLWAATLLSDMSFRLADAILLYRCYVVWFDHRWVVVLPVCVLLAGLGVNLRTYIPLTFYNAKLDAVDVFLLVGLNILLTSLISFRLIRAQKRNRLFSNAEDHSKVYFGALTILVESAAPVAVLGIALAVAKFQKKKSVKGNQTSFVLQILFSTAAVFAPQLIIFRVATGSSWADSTETSAMLSRPIEFTVPTQTRCDEESINEASNH